MPIQKLCSGDWDRTLQFSVFDWNRYNTCTVCIYVLQYNVCVCVYLLTSYCNCFRSGSHELIGKASCTLREIITDRYYKFTFYEFIIFAPPKAKCIYIG